MNEGYTKQNLELNQIKRELSHVDATKNEAISKDEEVITVVTTSSTMIIVLSSSTSSSGSTSSGSTDTLFFVLFICHEIVQSELQLAHKLYTLVHTLLLTKLLHTLVLTLHPSTHSTHFTP